MEDVYLGFKENYEFEQLEYMVAHCGYTLEAKGEFSNEGGDIVTFKKNKEDVSDQSDITPISSDNTFKPTKTRGSKRRRNGTIIQQEIIEEDRKSKLKAFQMEKDCLLQVGGSIIEEGRTYTLINLDGNTFKIIKPVTTYMMKDYLQCIPTKTPNSNGSCTVNTEDNIRKKEGFDSQKIDSISEDHTKDIIQQVNVTHKTKKLVKIIEDDSFKIDVLTRIKNQKFIPKKKLRIE